MTAARSTKKSQRPRGKVKLALLVPGELSTYEGRERRAEKVWLLRLLWCFIGVWVFFLLVFHWGFGVLVFYYWCFGVLLFFNLRKCIGVCIILADDDLFYVLFLNVFFFFFFFFLNLLYIYILVYVCIIIISITISITILFIIIVCLFFQCISSVCTFTIWEM